MEDREGVVTQGERAVYELRVLYEQYGYQAYRMSKFEEYDLYLQNRNFLKSKNIIAFNDPSGRLLALRPDVTLSIIKNVKDDAPGALRLYYNENVYRADPATHEIQEIMQAGLEYIGDVDLYALCEVIVLARRSLAAVGGEFAMDISHMGFVAGVLEAVEWPCGAQEQVLSCISRKNAHDILRLCAEAGVDAALAEKIAALATLCGPFEKTLEQARNLCISGAAAQALGELEALWQALSAAGEGASLNLDFSLVNDISYYNGIIFQGFLEGVPSAVLAGGRYDNLVRRLGKKPGAVGFAVYLDLLAGKNQARREYDVDALLLYDDATDIASLLRAANMLADTGQRVRVEKAVPGDVRYRQLLRMKEKGLEIESRP